MSLADAVQQAPKTADQIRAQLAEARVGFDHADQYADDYTAWSRYAARAALISDLMRQLAKAEAA